MTPAALEFTGIVVEGDQRGRTLGFPTANLRPPPVGGCPAPGVYAGLADGRPAAISVGYRPTFAQSTPGLLVEVHILDFDGDLYGRELTVRFIKRLRPELRFAGAAELIEQMRWDLDQVRAMLPSGDQPHRTPAKSPAERGRSAQRAAGVDRAL